MRAGRHRAVARIEVRAHHGVDRLVVTASRVWATRSFWWPGRYVVTFDSYTYGGPNLVVTEAALAVAACALWNDAIFGGVTHLGNPQAGTLYPPRLLALLLEDNRALGVLVAAHVVLLGLGMVALTRRLGFGALGRGVRRRAAVLNGAVLTKSMQFEQILVIAWAPWLLVADRTPTLTGRSSVAGRRRDCRRSTAAILLAGHPQMVFETIVARRRRRRSASSPPTRLAPAAAPRRRRRPRRADRAARS